MNNFDKYLFELTQYQFIESMILNCDGCPAYPCDLNESIRDGGECQLELNKWCEEPADL